MNDGPPVWIGADPGGEGNFGLAIWEEGAPPETRCVDCAEEAVQVVAARLNGKSPSGAGIDAPLWWSSGRSGIREADLWIRRTYKLHPREVQAVNSLRGAALVQAMMFIERLREVTGEETPVTEVHPKALLKISTQGDWAAFATRYGVEYVSEIEHERDAVIGAVAAREGFGGRWRRDLSIVRLAEEQDPRAYWLAPVHYFWPD